jgi:RimJ/RimL family protein N-acetyltransferase
MNQILQEKLVILLNKICIEKIKDNISILNINGDEELILKGVLFDNEATCDHSYNSIDDIVTGLMVSADNYGIYIKDEFIGIISVFYKYYKDLSRLEMSISIKEEYRNKKIGEFCYDYVIRNYFEDYDIKSIHLSIREDNMKSRKLALKFGFKEYPGYKDSKYFIDLDGNKIPQVQYLLKRKDYIK